MARKNVAHEEHDEKTDPQLDANPLALTEVVGNDDLSAAEREFLHERESIIDRGFRVFVEVGTALAEIKNHKDGVLVRRYGGFEQYCEERWGFGLAYGYRLMEAAKVVQELSPRGENATKAVLPTSEKQVRELTQLELPEHRREAWEKIVENAGGNPILVADVRKVVSGVMKEHRIKPRRSKKRAKDAFIRIKVSDVAKMSERLKTLRAKVSKLLGGQKLHGLLAEIEELITR